MPKAVPRIQLQWAPPSPPSPPCQIVQLLLHGCLQDLDKTTIGIYLGEREDFNIRVMHAFIDALDFHSMEFDQAIRTFLAGFRYVACLRACSSFPGEAGGSVWSLSQSSIPPRPVEALGCWAHGTLTTLVSPSAECD